MLRLHSEDEQEPNDDPLIVRAENVRFSVRQTIREVSAAVGYSEVIRDMLRERKARRNEAMRQQAGNN